jgi:DNA-binding transcriptional ArsR family regulator
VDTLLRLLSSRVKAETLRLLFGPGTPELHVREIARRARLNEATVRQELKRLTSLGLLTARRDGNRVYYRANDVHPLYADLRNIVLKTSGLADVLRDVVARSPVRAAFVFGSFANGRETAGSDIDLMIVGTVSLRDLARPLSRAAARLGREINPVVLSVREFAERRRKEEHLVTSVLRGPKLFVIGDERELDEVSG